MATSIFAPVVRNKPLVEFRAGKMQIRGKTVTADKRKGLIQLELNEDTLIHFKWKDRTTGAIETDLIIFPDEVVFKKIKQCQTGRVYILEWKTNRRMFFWMQEPSEDKDEEYCSKINEYINNPPSPTASPSSGGGFGGLDQNQLMQMMASMGGGGGLGARSPSRSSASRSSRSGATSSATPSAEAPAEATPAPSSVAPAISSDYLQNVLSGLQGAGEGAGEKKKEDTNLTDVIDPELLVPFLSNPSVQEKLIDHLPEGLRTPEELTQSIHSPQFQQALQALDQALQSGQLADLMPLFGLPQNVGGSQGGVNALLKALQEQNQTQETKEQKGDDTKMDVDTEEKKD